MKSITRLVPTAACLLACLASTPTVTALPPAVVVAPIVPAEGTDAKWAVLLRKEIGRNLTETCRLRTVTRKYGMRMAGLRPNDPPTRPQAIEMARHVGAQRVVHGTLTHTGKTWSCDIAVLHAGTGEGPQWNASGDDWRSFHGSLMKRLLRELEVDPEVLDLTPETRTPEMLEAVAEYLAAGDGETTNPQGLEMATRLTELDPESFLAWMFVGTEQTDSDRKAAIKAYEKAHQLAPTGPISIWLEATAAFMAGKQDEAERGYQQLVEALPNTAEAHAHYGSFLMTTTRSAEALPYLLRAVELDPACASHQVDLGRCFAALNRLGDAEECLTDAVRLAAGDPPLLEEERSIALLALQIGRHSTARIALHRATLAAEASQAPARTRKQIARFLEGIEDRLTPVAVEATRPRMFSRRELQQELAARLTPAEQECIVDPFGTSAEMRRWARETVGDEISPRGKTSSLLNALSSRPNRYIGNCKPRTAREAFEDRLEPREYLTHDDRAILLVALGREAGLDMWLTTVHRNAEGGIVDRCCAALFVDNECFLVDPFDFWFGVPHREFRVLDDLQAIAFHLFRPVPGRPVEKGALIAEKLDPASISGLFLTADQLTVAGRFDEAETRLARAERREPDRWELPFHRGMIAAARNNDVAKQLYEKALEIHPAAGRAHIALAGRLTADGRLKEARDHLKKAETCHLLPGHRLHVRRVLAELNAALAEEDESPVALGRRLLREGKTGDSLPAFQTALEEQPESGYLRAEICRLLHSCGMDIEAGELLLEDARRRIITSDEDWNRAAAALAAGGSKEKPSQAIREGLEQHPDSAVLMTQLGSYQLLAGDAGTIRTLRKAVDLDPEWSHSHLHLGYALMIHGEFDQAAREIAEAERLGIRKQISGMLYATCLAWEGRYDQAASALRDPMTDPDTPEAPPNTARFNLLGTMSGLRDQLATVLRTAPREDTDRRIGEVVSQMSASMLEIASMIPQPEIDAYLNHHREELIAGSGERELTTISIVKNGAAEPLAAKIHATLSNNGTVEHLAEEYALDDVVRVGDRDWYRPDDLAGVLREPAAKLQAGGVSEPVEGPGHWFLVVVHQIRAGEDDEGHLREGARNAIIAERRRAWEKWIVERLRNETRDASR